MRRDEIIEALLREAEGYKTSGNIRRFDEVMASLAQLRGDAPPPATPPAPRTDEAGRRRATSRSAATRKTR